MKRQSGTSRERLVDWLRRNDPGAERPLDAEERSEMSRQMLLHLQERRSVVGWRWAWGLAGVVALVAGVGLFWSGLERPEDVTPRNAATSNVATSRRDAERLEQRRAATESDTGQSSKAPLKRQVVETPESEHTGTVPDTSGERRVAEKREPGRGAPAEGADAEAVARLSDAADAMEQPVRSLELRFTAPGGTQLVWKLDPQFELRTKKEGEKGRRG